MALLTALRPRRQACAQAAVGAAPSLPPPGWNPRQLQEESENDLKHGQYSVAQVARLEIKPGAGKSTAGLSLVDKRLFCEKQRQGDRLDCYLLPFSPLRFAAH